MRGPADHCLTCERWELRDKQDSKLHEFKRLGAAGLCVQLEPPVFTPLIPFPFCAESVERVTRFGKEFRAQLSFERVSKSFWLVLR